MSKPEIGAGDVPITIDGNDVVLRPTLEACLSINKNYGNLQTALNRLIAFDFDTTCDIIKIGLGLNPNQAKDLPKAVFEAGVIDLRPACLDFIHNILNGGRPIETDENGEAAAPDPLAKPSQSENSTDA